MLKDLIKRNRSYRRFYQNIKIDIRTLRDLVDLTRFVASAANLQPLKYIISNESVKNEKIFKTLSWAGYLDDWKGPSEGQKPSAYIVVLGDTDIIKTFGCDHGIAVQTILLGACERGLGGCIVGAINRKELLQALDIPDRYEILLVVALGRPREKVVLERVKSNGDIKYWRDGKGTHHVPKRPLNEIIIG